MANTTVTVSDTDATTVTVSSLAPDATSIRGVGISATAPSAGQGIVATSATAAAWTNIVTQAELDAFVGTTNIVTLGTITTGVWSGTAIATTKGGTGLTAYTLGDLLYASATNVLSALAGNTTTTRKFLRQTGTGSASAAPAWDTLTAADIAAGTFIAGTYSFTGSTLTLADTLAGTPTWSSTQSLNTSGNAATATLAATVTVVDSTSASCYVAIFDAATGSLAVKTDAGLTYVATTGILTATGFAGPLVGNVTGNASGSSGSCTGNAATATALATARAINGVDFDGSAAITVAAAAGTLTGTALAATVATSSLTSVGTLSSGAVPASLVTAGSFGAGDYTFTGKLTFAGTPTLADGTIGLTAVNGLTLRAVEGSSYDFAVLSKTNGALLLGIEGTVITIPGDVTITTGRLYVQGTSAASIIDKALQVGNAANSGTRLSVGLSQTDTATGAAARKLYVGGVLAAAANNDVLYGAEIAPTVTVGAYTGTTFYGLKIGDISGAATNFALYTGAGAVRFGGQVTSAVTTGTAPFVVASTTVVANLNVSQLLGATWAAPAAIGSGTPAAGTFAALKATGGLILGSLATAATTNGLDIQSGGIGLVIGADNSLNTRTNATNKESRIGFAHYTNAEEPVAFFLASSKVSTSVVGFGGGSSVLNAATDIGFWTAANTTTVAGTERLRIIGSGYIGIAETLRVCLDGVEATGDTYIVSPSANVLDLYAGAANTLRLTATAATVTGTLTATGVTSVTDATDASSATAAALKTAGGIACVKSAWIGAALKVVGALTTDGGILTFGANDTGGAGYRLVLVPNTA